jgi:hypothetical protein
VKPVIAVLWILSIALAVGLTRLAGPGPTRLEDPDLTRLGDPDREESEFSRSLADVFSEFDPFERAYLMSHSLREIRPDDLPELKRVLEDENMGILPEEAQLIMLAWARIDAPGAYAWASAESGNWRWKLTENAIYAWAYHDGPAAIRAAEEVEDLDSMERLKQQAIEGWLRSDDRQGITEYIALFPDMKRRGRLFFRLAGEIVMTEGRDDAMLWVESLPDDTPNNLKLGVFHHVAKMVASKEPVVAGEWFLKHRERPYSEGALSGIALRWVQNHDRPAAFEWLLAMDTDGVREGEREDAIAQAFRSWMQNSPDTAQPWLLSMLPNPDLDPAIKEAAKRLLPTEPRTALEWAQRFDDETQRDAHTVRAGIRWRSAAPKAFDDWLEEKDLPEAVEQKILAAKLPQQRGARNLNARPAAARRPGGR